MSMSNARMEQCYFSIATTPGRPKVFSFRRWLVATSENLFSVAGDDAVVHDDKRTGNSRTCIRTARLNRVSRREN